MKKWIISLLGLSLAALLLPLQACQSASANNFGVLSLEVTPNSVIENDKFTATAVINNASKNEATYIVPVMVNGIADDRTTVILAPGQSQEIHFTLRRGEAGKYEISIGDKSYLVLVEKLIPAFFKLSDLKINMEVANPGEEVVITADIANTGGSEGTYTAELKINGVTEQAEKVVMKPGASFVLFKVTKTQPGTYTVGIDDLSGKYTVQKPAETIQLTTPAPEVQKRFTQRPSSCCPGGTTTTGGACP